MAINVYKIRVYYADNVIEEISGVIDYHNQIIKIIDIEDSSAGFKEKGFVSFNFIKRTEVIEKIGCLGRGENLVC